MRFTIGRKLALTFGAILSLMLVSTILSYMKSVDMRQQQNLALAVRAPSVAACKDLQRDLNQAASKARQSILAGAEPQNREEAKKLLDAAWDDIAKDAKHLDELSHSWTAPEDREHLAETESQLPELRQILEESSRLAATGEREAITHAGNFISDKGIVVNDAIKKSLGELSNSQERMMEENATALSRSTDQLNLTLWISTLIALAFGIVTALIMSRRISAITRSISVQAEAIAGGDLSLEDLRVLSDDELGDLTRSINKVNDSLISMITAILQNSQQVASASAELSASSQQISANSEETSAQANAVSQAAQQVSQNLQGVSAGGEEMTSTIQSIASNAHEAASIASKAVQTAQAANVTVGKLGESSAEIGEVIKVITSIAQQTKLLALNATIEAACRRSW